MIMDHLYSKISIRIHESVYLKDPESSDLGRKIIRGSIDMIDELGFEEFTFKKLATKIKSTEASIYRYFVNKHYLLSYLTLWYWGWQEYRLVMGLLNVEDPQVRLKRAVRIVTEQIVEDSTFLQVNEVKLDRIVTAESVKVYLNKNVDADNSMGIFTTYKDLVQRIADIIMEINPNYKYPHMLVSTIIEGARHQRYFAEHLPRLTDVVEGEDAVEAFSMQLIESLLDKNIQK